MTTRTVAQCKSRAFTLIELLVVIAIIAILVSILMPSLSQAKELARNAACLSSLRNLAPSMALYRDSFQDWVPIAAGPTWTTGGQGMYWFEQLGGANGNHPDVNGPENFLWGNQLLPFTSRNLFECAAAKYTDIAQSWKWGYSVVYNVSFTRKPANVGWNAYYDPMKTEWLRDDPNQTMYLLDGCAGYGTSYPYLPVNHVHTGNVGADRYISTYGHGPINTDKYVSDRHRGYCNYLTFGGSVGRVEVKKLAYQIEGKADCIWDR